MTGGAGSDAAPNPVEYLAAELCGCITAGIATNAEMFGGVLDGLPPDRLKAKLATLDLYLEGFQNCEFGAYEEAARAMLLKARKQAEGRADADLG